MIANSTLRAPSKLTKLLRVQDNVSSGERWVRLSSNLLPVFGFTPDVRFTPRVIGHGMQGLELTIDQAELFPRPPCKVHVRSYQRRRNNPLETHIDLKSQAVIRQAVPSWCEQLHFTLSDRCIRAIPVPNRTFNIRTATRHDNPRRAFVALSSGVDGWMLSQQGFSLKALLEWRPPEKRDGLRNLTETGVVSALTNAPYEIVYNEDIRRINWNQVASDLRGVPISLACISLACDDHANVKSARLREREAAAGETSARDLVYDALRLVETVQPAAILVENIANFKSSFEAVLLRTKLRQWGYFVDEAILDARDFGGLTSRKRYHLVGSVWPGYAWPAPMRENKAPLSHVLGDLLDGCRDITNNENVQKAIGTSRARIAQISSTYAPTILKSQSRQAKDTSCLEKNGRVLIPSEAVLLKLQGIDGFDLSLVNTETASEIIGQSVDGPMHRAIIASVHQHLEAQ